jgi:hypothetical protein
LYFCTQNGGKVKTQWFRYAIIFGLILSMLESNNIPVLSVFNNLTAATTPNEDDSAEAPVKEAESMKIESAKDYPHEVFNFSFNEPVVVLTVQHPDLFKTKYPYTFYPDVPTPPPNC